MAGLKRFGTYLRHHSSRLAFDRRERPPKSDAGFSRNALTHHLRLYLVTDSRACTMPNLMTTVQLAVANGVTMVQLREKTATTAQRVQMAQALKQILDGTGVPLVINDDVAAAVAADVDGAHIGQGDITAAQARALLGPDKILGLSCETADAVQAADPALVDYLGLGPVFGTATKTDHAQPIGFDGLARLVALSPRPSVAIGGLKPIHVSDVRDSGADGMAVVSAICGQADPAAAARAFRAKSQKSESDFWVSRQVQLFDLSCRRKNLRCRFYGRRFGALKTEKTV